MERSLRPLPLPDAIMNCGRNMQSFIARALKIFSFSVLGPRLCAGLLAIGAAAPVASQQVPFDSIAQRAAPCMTCHGQEGKASSDGYYPRIAGKPAGYLYNQLVNFRDGQRQQYPLMIYTVRHLSDAYLREIATYFADQHPPYPPPQRHDLPQSTLDKGRMLVLKGDAARNIPACVACHGEALTGVTPTIPGLLGLPRDYINSQFGAWREGARRAAAPDCMAEIAKRMTPEEITAAAAWLSSQPAPANALPASSPAGKLPISCGSYPQQAEGQR
jgi:cytochrome c553